MQKIKIEKKLNMFPAHGIGLRMAVALGFVIGFVIMFLFSGINHAYTLAYLQQNQKHAMRVARAIASAVAGDPISFTHTVQTAKKTDYWRNVNALLEKAQGSLDASIYIVSNRINGEYRYFASTCDSVSPGSVCPLMEYGPGLPEAMETGRDYIVDTTFSFDWTNASDRRPLIFVPILDAEDAVIGAIGIILDMDKAIHGIQAQIYRLLAAALTGVVAWSILWAHWIRQYLDRPLRATAWPLAFLTQGNTHGSTNPPGLYSRGFFSSSMRQVARAKKSLASIASDYTIAQADQMGGYLSVDRKPGAGSKFIFMPPLEAAPGRTAPSPADVPSPADTAAQGRSFTGKVLICEDNFINQIVLKEHIRKLGMVVDVAEDGHQGVQLVMEHMALGNPYDLILMDIQMPVMDGLEAATILNRMGSTTPILAVTAGILSDEQNKCLQCGISGFIFKPFRKQELHNCLADFLPIVDKAPEDAPKSSETNGSTGLKILDWEEGLSSAMNNPEFYKHQLTNFYQGNQTCYDLLCHALASGDTAQSHRIAHSLRSTSRLIGAQRLQAAAQRLDLALQAGVSDPSQMLQDLGDELNLVLDAIVPHLPKAEASQESQDPVQAFADELDAQLRARRAGAVSYVEKIPNVFAESGDLCEKLIQHILAYDFDEARKVLAQVRSIPIRSSVEPPSANLDGTT